MFDYEKLFEPFIGNGATLEKSVAWVKKKTHADDKIMDQVVADTMNLIVQGEKFELPCPCGCGLEHVNVPIEHFMIARAADLKSKAHTAYTKILEENEKQRLQARMKQLSNFDKEYDKMRNGTFWNKFKKFIGAPYEKWETEK
jgi:hypothetical protein